MFLRGNLIEGFLLCSLFATDGSGVIATSRGREIANGSGRGTEREKRAATAAPRGPAEGSLGPHPRLYSTHLIGKNAVDLATFNSVLKIVFFCLFVASRSGVRVKEQGL